MRVRVTPALKHFEMPKHYFNPNTISTQTLCQPEHYFNPNTFSTWKFSDSEQNLKNLSGPSHRIAKFEKFERTDTIRETLKIGIWKNSKITQRGLRIRIHLIKSHVKTFQKMASFCPNPSIHLISSFHHQKNQLTSCSFEIRIRNVVCSKCETSNDLTRPSNHRMKKLSNYYLKLQLLA